MGSFYGQGAKHVTIVPGHPCAGLRANSPELLQIAMLIDHLPTLGGASSPQSPQSGNAMPSHARLPKTHEIDLTIVSDVEKARLILEVKAFLGPAEPREIRDRSQQITRGIQQVKARTEAHKRHPKC
jgi:hypothetical protein